MFARRKSHGFTLVELLVAIAIIGVLASVVLVSLQGAKQNSRDTQRKSDLQQVQVALRVYRDSHPTAGYPSYPSGDVLGDGAGFDALLAPYLANSISDPLSPDSDYQYVYDSDFDCSVAGTGKKVLYAKALENGGGNWEALCGTAVPGTTDIANTYGIILQ